MNIVLVNEEKVQYLYTHDIITSDRDLSSVTDVSG